MFEPTIVVGADEPEVKLVEVPKTASADMPLRNSWCPAGNLLKLVPWAPWMNCGAYAEETTRVANKRRLSFAIFKSLWVEFTLKYCLAFVVKLKIFQSEEATITLITLYNLGKSEDISSLRGLGQRK
jgi:hypothetical protein